MSSVPLPDNRVPFSIEEALQATGGVLVQQGPSSVLGVCTDTRALLAGNAFVALSGERFDGHRFLDQAVAAGADLLVVERSRASDVPRGPSVISVPDTTTALGDLARWHRLRWGNTVIAIAGSAGKTTTRAVVEALLCALRPGLVHRTRGNFNNRIGVPLTLLGCLSHHSVCVLELGTNRPGEVAELCRISRPDIGLLTLIDLEHTENLGDLDGVEAEEGDLLASLSPMGVAIGYGDDARVRRQMNASPALKKLSYGTDPSSDLVVGERALLTPIRSLVELSLLDQKFRVQSALCGLSGALSAGAAVLTAHALFPEELNSAVIESALGDVRVPGRSTVLTLPSGTLVVDDTYNSNPASVRLSVQNGRELTDFTGGRLWLVLGDMLELGELSEGEHREMGRFAASSGAYALCTVGDQARWATDEARAAGFSSWHFHDADEVGPVLAPKLASTDIVVVKASRGVRAERIVRYLLDAPSGKGGSTP